MADPPVHRVRLERLALRNAARWIEAMLATAYNYRASATVRRWNQLRSIVERAPDDFGTQPERYRYAFTSSHYHGAFAPATPTSGAHGARCHARVTMAHLARQEASRCFAKTT